MIPTEERFAKRIVWLASTWYWLTRSKDWDEVWSLKLTENHYSFKLCWLFLYRAWFLAERTGNAPEKLDKQDGRSDRPQSLGLLASVGRKLYKNMQEKRNPATKFHWKILPVDGPSDPAGLPAGDRPDVWEVARGGPGVVSISNPFTRRLAAEKEALGTQLKSAKHVFTSFHIILRFSYFYTTTIHLVLWCFFMSKQVRFCSADIVLQPADWIDCYSVSNF